MQPGMGFLVVLNVNHGVVAEEDRLPPIASLGLVDVLVTALSSRAKAIAREIQEVLAIWRPHSLQHCRALPTSLRRPGAAYLSKLVGIWAGGGLAPRRKGLYLDDLRIAERDLLTKIAIVPVVHPDVTRLKAIAFLVCVKNRGLLISCVGIAQFGANLLARHALLCPDRGAAPAT